MFNENQKKTIFVCEDDEGILDLACIILRSEGYEVVPMSNSENIDALVLALRPSLIFMDLWMPGEGGEAATRRLKNDKSTSDIPVVIMSANRDAEHIGKAAGADGVLMKPFNIGQLVGAAQLHAGAS